MKYQAMADELVKIMFHRPAALYKKDKSKFASLSILMGGMGAGKSTLAKRLASEFDIVEGSDLGQVIGNQWVDPPKEDKARLRLEKAQRLLEAHKQGKRVLLEGGGVTKYPPELLQSADRVVYLSVPSKVRLERVKKRSTERGIKGDTDVLVFDKKEEERFGRLPAALRRQLGDRYLSTASHNRAAEFLTKRAADELKKIAVHWLERPEKGRWTARSFPERVSIRGSTFLKAHGIKRHGSVAQYREDVPRNSRHLYVLPNRTYVIDHKDSYNPSSHPIRHFFADVLPSTGRLLRVG